MFEFSCENCRHSLTNLNDTWNCLVCPKKMICIWCYVDYTAKNHPNLNVVHFSKKSSVTEAERRQAIAMEKLGEGFPT